MRTRPPRGESDGSENRHDPLGPKVRKEFMRLQFEAQAAKAQRRKPQPAQPDPARGSMEWFFAQEKLKNSS